MPNLKERVKEKGRAQGFKEDLNQQPPARPKPSSLDQMPGLDAAAKERIRNMIAKNRGMASKMAETSKQLAKEAQQSNPGDELFHLKEPSKEEMAQFGFD